MILYYRKCHYLSHLRCTRVGTWQSLDYMDNPFSRPTYLDKFGLKEPPYTTNPDERYLFLTEVHEEAIHMCGRLISNREGAGLGGR